MAEGHERLTVELVKAVVPVLVGGLLALYGTWYGGWQAHMQWEESNKLEEQRARQVHELETKALELTHQLELKRIGAERLLVLRTQYVSEFMGQAALCVREAVQNATSEQMVPIQEYMKEMRTLQNLSEAAGLFVSDASLKMMSDLVVAIRKLNIVTAKQQPSVEEMSGQRAVVQELMDKLRARLRKEIVPSESVP